MYLNAFEVRKVKHNSDVLFQGSRNMLTQVCLCYPNHGRYPGGGGAHAHLPVTVAYILSKADVGRESGKTGL